jgi:hypothetical protein
MGTRFLSIAAIVLFLRAGSPAILLGDDEERPPFKFEEWLARPELKDIPWQVWTTPPVFTHQQRHLVAIRAVINCGKLKNRNHERILHFVLRVADEKNGWTTDYDYTPIHVFSRLDRAHEVHYVSGVYLRPGRYTFALMVYDDLTKLGSIRQKKVIVPPLKKDPLPDLDRDLPNIQFTSGVEMERFDFSPSLNRDWEWPLAKGKEWLPVHNNRRLCIDIVINSTAVGFFTNPGILQPMLLRMASVISHFQLSNGCVRVTLLDMSRMKTLIDRQDAAGFDWQSASELLKKENQDKIDVGLLESGNAPWEFLGSRLKEIAESGGCETETEVPLKVIVFVAPFDKLPEKTDIRPVHLKNDSSVRIFTIGIYGNDLSAIIKGIRPQAFPIGDGLEFRRTLASLISALEKAN